MPMTIKNFIEHHFRHFNAAALKDAALGYVNHLNAGHKMFMSLAGAMSTAELGLSLAEMIRQDKVHAISCTGANLEEDLFNLVAHTHYKRIPNYRDLTPEQEQDLVDNGYNRVTDTCIPEEEAFRKIQKAILSVWQKAEQEGKRYFPHEYLYQIIESKVLESEYEIDPKDSWLVAACEKKLPIYVGGWEDSTLGNIIVSCKIREEIKSTHIVKSGLEYMEHLIKYYTEINKTSRLGFFQIGGGIAGDFPICVTPLINQDLELDVPLWNYFCQISDSTTSYGSYSGAVPNEKITWGKLGIKTPKFIIESDATIVAPLIFAYVLNQ